jgi:mannose-1-phosphate guanylyltransferase
MPDSDNTYAVIMAGGSGTRFWPLSRNVRPKQLVRIVGDTTMIQATVARLQPLIPAERILVVTTVALAEETRDQLPMIRPDHVIAEPVGRDTAACVCLAAVLVERIKPGATMVLLPSDHVIATADQFQRALAAGIAVANEGHLVTYGISPRHAATGYGYIQVAERLPDVEGITVHKALRFVEKPDEATAKGYLVAGDYRWNSGIFTWRAATVLDQLEAHCPALTKALTPLARWWGKPEFVQKLNLAYQPLQRISIDYALMEKAKDICVVGADFTWDDVGSWDSLYDRLKADERGVVVRGEVVNLDCADSLLINETGQLLAGVGLKGVSVIVTNDAILVVPKGRSQDVKRVVEELKKRNRADLL